MRTMRHPSLAQVLAAGALSCAAASTLLAACASNESASPDVPDATVTLTPPQDAGLGDADADACATDDCEYFPPACAPDVLCPNGPFDTTNPTMGLDWRTRINVIVGRSARDVWFAGAAGAVAHFDGTSWTPSEVGTQETQNILWFLDSAEVLLGALNPSKRIYTRGLEVDAGSPVSAGGWSLQPALQASSDFWQLTAAWFMPGSKSLWLASDRALWRLHRTPESTFEILPGVPSSVCDVIPCRSMRSIHGASESIVWAVGDVGAAVRISNADGVTPTATPLNTMTWMGLSGVWAASDTDVWAVGGTGTILHYTGEPPRWDIVSDVPTDENLNAVWGTSPSDIWAVGNAGVVLHYDGSRWSRVKVAGVGIRRPDLYTVWSPGAGHVWIGGQGILLALGGKP